MQCLSHQYSWSRFNRTTIRVTKSRMRRLGTSIFKETSHQSLPDRPYHLMGFAFPKIFCKSNHCFDSACFASSRLIADPCLLPIYECPESKNSTSSTITAFCSRSSNPCFLPQTLHQKWGLKSQIFLGGMPPLYNSWCTLCSLIRGHVNHYESGGYGPAMYSKNRCTHNEHRSNWGKERVFLLCILFFLYFVHAPTTFLQKICVYPDLL